MQASDHTTSDSNRLQLKQGVFLAITGGPDSTNSLENRKDKNRIAYAIDSIQLQCTVGNSQTSFELFWNEE